MPKSCCAFDCTNHNMMATKMSFSIFPDREKFQERWEKWVTAISRMNVDGSKWQPGSRYTYVCQDHFITGKSNPDPLHPDYIPSIFTHKGHKSGLPKEEKLRDEREKSASKIKRYNRKRRLVTPPPLTETESASCSTCFGADLTEDVSVSSPGLADVDVQECLPPTPQEPPPETTPMAAPLTLSEREMMLTEIDNLRSEKEGLKGEVDDLHKQLAITKLDPSAIEGNDKQTKFLTGLSWEVFSTVLGFISDVAPTRYQKFKMPLKQQLLFTLVKLRHNVSFEYLALQMGAARSTLCDLFWNMIDLLHAKLTFLIRWPEKEFLKRTVPPVFKTHFPRLTGIMDCFEIFIDRPVNLKARAEVYSNYKKHSTIKVFIVCSPLGAVTFMSKVWGGRASDNEIVRNSGFIDPQLHHPGDQLLADRGFTLQDDFAAATGAELLLPSFTKGRKQMSPKDVETSRQIAAVRIHIERVIGLIKNRYTILQGPIPIPMVKSLTDEADDAIPSVEKLIKVCGALTNLGESIVYNE